MRGKALVQKRFFKAHVAPPLVFASSVQVRGPVYAGRTVLPGDSQPSELCGLGPHTSTHQS